MNDQTPEKNRDQTTGIDAGGSWEDVARRTAPQNIKLPKEFSALRLKNGVRLRIYDIDRLLNRSSTVTYRFRWANGVDSSTTAGLDAGFARSTIIGAIDAPGKDDQESTLFISDATYANGYYYCTGVDSLGNESTDYVTSSLFTSDILDYAVPGDVTHFSCSESGEEANGTTYSAISYSMQAPIPLGSFAGVQFYLEDYPNIGQISAWTYHHFYGIGGASIVGKELYAPGRRVGVGTVSTSAGSAIVTGTGTNFLNQCKAGDQVEILGTRGTILSVDSATQITMPGTWPGNLTLTTQAFYLIALVTVYAVSVSKGGTERGDVTNSPKVTMLFDAELSPPSAPTLAATILGNNILLTITPLIGTQLDHYIIYRGTGAGVALSACTAIKSLSADTNNTSGALQFVDTSFTTYQREQGQVFSYYATAVNVRGGEGSASTRVEAAARLNAPADGAPTIPAGSLAQNLLFNSFIFGTPGLEIKVTEASQDTYSGAAPAGFARWGNITTSTVTKPDFQSQTEAEIFAPGATFYHGIVQSIGAWQAAAGSTRIDKGRNMMLSFYARSGSATLPNGSLTMEIYMYNGATLVGRYQTKRRNSSTDVYDDYSEIVLGTAGKYGHEVAGSALSTTQSLIYALFSPQTIPATVDTIEVRILHQNTSNAIDIYITKAMLCFGEDLAAWTPLLSTSLFPNAGGPIPGPPPDREGLDRGGIRVP